MSKNIKIAILGLGSVGQEFAEHFLEIIQEGGKAVEIVAVSDRQLDSPIALGFKQNGVPVFEHATGVIGMGDKIDIIFDLTGEPETRKALREGMMESKNGHTVIAPEVMAHLLWMFFDTDESWKDEIPSGY